ncbi:MAG: hypothetical protein IKN39_02115 [Clostridia bacterium]|nr:hypothetical protein [Clostridia bacterium]
MANKPYNENKKKYNMEYERTKIHRIPLNVQNAKYDEIKSHAEKQGETVNGFIKRAIDEQIKRDNQEGENK